MSLVQSAQPAANAANDQGQQNVSTTSEGTAATVLPFPTTTQNPSTSTPVSQAESTDHTVHPFTKAAYDVWHAPVNSYMDAAGRKQMECRRHYFPLPAAQDIVAALGRQLTVEDMDLLVGLDGDPVVCFVTKREFQPVWWVLVTDRLLSAIEAKKTIDESVLRSVQAIKVGQFFPNPDRSKVEHYAVSGVPYFWKKGVDNAFATWSPLFKAREKINGGRWGENGATIARFLSERQAQIDERRQREDGLNQLATIFNQADNHKNQTGRDRRRR